MPVSPSLKAGRYALFLSDTNTTRDTKAQLSRSFVQIFWAMSVTNRNPEYFSDPEKFEPSRFLEKEHLPYTFLPFGAGPRMCAGNEYARLAILVFMHNLVTKFKWDVLFPDEKVSGGMIMPAPVKGLPVRLHPRPSSVAA